MRTTTLREELHDLVDQLANENLLTARERLIELVDAQPRPSLDEVLANALVDDEPLTEEDVAALEEARREIAEGKQIRDEYFWRELEIKTDGE